MLMAKLILTNQWHMMVMYILTCFKMLVETMENIQEIVGKILVLTEFLLKFQRSLIQLMILSFSQKLEHIYIVVHPLYYYRFNQHRTIMILICNFQNYSLKKMIGKKILFNLLLMLKLPQFT